MNFTTVTAWFSLKNRIKRYSSGQGAKEYRAYEKANMQNI